jgi:hypothetical protein
VYSYRESQYFSYMVASSFIGEENGVPGENHRPVASHRQTLSHNAASSTPRLSWIHNSQRSGDRYIRRLDISDIK